MAGNSSIFYLRREKNDTNIKQWQNWSVEINYVVSQFNDVVQNLTDKLEMAETTIDALKVKIQKLAERIGEDDLKYVKLQYNNIEIGSSKNSVYTKTCGVFSSVNTGVNTINIYSLKNISGLYINNQEVYSKTTGEYSLPFIQIPGSDAGTIINIKSDNMTKLGENVELYFSTDSQVKNASIQNFDPNNDDIAKLVINVKYSTVITQKLITTQKSELSKALQKAVPISTDAISIDKYGAQLGRYSTVKTVSQVAKNKIK